MTTNAKPYEILTGVLDLFIAPVGTAFPAVDVLNAALPVAWRALGFTQDGLTIKKGSKVEKVNVDQETGAVKAARSEESATFGTKLAELTLENLADYIGNTVTDTAPGSGTIGTRSVGLYSGAYVKTFAFLFRGKSTYGDFPSQYQLPFGYFDGDAELKYEKGKNASIPISIEALVDPDATVEEEKFGKLVMQDAVAL